MNITQKVSPSPSKLQIINRCSLQLSQSISSLNKANINTKLIMQMAPPRHPKNTKALNITKGTNGKKYSSELYLASEHPTTLFNLRTYIEMFSLHNQHSIPWMFDSFALAFYQSFLTCLFILSAAHFLRHFQWTCFIVPSHLQGIMKGPYYSRQIRHSIMMFLQQPFSTPESGSIQPASIVLIIQQYFSSVISKCFCKEYSNFYLLIQIIRKEKYKKNKNLRPECFQSLIHFYFIMASNSTLI